MSEVVLTIKPRSELKEFQVTFLKEGLEIFRCILYAEDKESLALFLNKPVITICDIVLLVGEEITNINVMEIE